MTTMARCPFCGSSGCDTLPNRSMFQVVCDACYARGPLEETKSEAVRSWNQGIMRSKVPVQSNNDQEVRERVREWSDFTKDESFDYRERKAVAECVRQLRELLGEDDG